MARWLQVCVSVALAVAALLGSGCGALPRQVPPRELADRAVVPGMPHVRFPGDRVTPEFEAWLVAGSARERARLAEEGVTALPPAAFLALSGGGSDGAFGAGLLCGWSARGDRPSFRVVTGISTGALIAPFAFAGSEYDHVLREVYTSIRTADIARRRGILDGLTSDGLLDPQPLRAIVAKHVDLAFLSKVAEEYRKGRGLVIGTTNLDTQRPTIWAMGAIAASGHPDSLELFRDIMVASASIPGVFPPVLITVEVDGKTYQEMHADGGTASQVFLYPASFSVKQYAEARGLKRERTVYVIRNAKLGPEYTQVPRRTLAIAQRAVSTLIKTQGVGDLYRIYLGCMRDELGYRLAYIPEEFAHPSTEMFDPAYMRNLFDFGYRRALEGYPWAEAPPGFEPPRSTATAGAP